MATWTPPEIIGLVAGLSGLATALATLVKSFHTDSKFGAVDAKADAAINATGELRDTADWHDSQITDMAGTVSRVEAAVNVAGKMEDVLAAVKAANTSAPATPPATDAAPTAAP